MVGVYIAELGHTAEWYFDRDIFIDICNRIVPTSEVKAKTQALARKGKKNGRSQALSSRTEIFRRPRRV